MHAAENNHVRARFRRLLRQAEGIADVVRHVLDFRHLVIVREDDSIELFFERENFLRQRLESAFRHRAARLDFSNINHLPKLPLRISGVKPGGTACRRPKYQGRRHGVPPNYTNSPSSNWSIRLTCRQIVEPEISNPHVRQPSVPNLI